VSRRQGAQVEVIGMNQAARTLVDQVGRFEKEHLPTAAAH
jgi:SulP family sulfate permease